MDRFTALYPDHEQGRLLSDIMSSVYFTLPSLRIAENLAASGTPVRVFQFSYDLPGLDGAYHAVHTGDIPFLFGNHGPDDLVHFPTFDGIDRQRLEAVSARAMDLYGAVIRGEDPGTRWPVFDAEDRRILWLGDVVEPRSGLLNGDIEALAEAGLPGVPAIEARLVANVRAALR